MITPAADVGITVPLYPFRTATVFSQEPQTPQLLAVEYDATAEDVLDNVKGEWQPLSFRQKGDYSYVDGHGDMSALPFPGSLTWMPQLLPVCYNCRDTNLAAAGLIGKLPLLISLVAFSCPPTTLYLDYVLTNHVFPGMWYPHDGLTGRESLQFQCMTLHVPKIV